MTELAVAIVVLGIVLVGLFPLVINSVQLAVQNSEVAQANQIVASQLEAERASRHGNSCNVIDPPAPPNESKLSAAEKERFALFVKLECQGERIASLTVYVFEKQGGRVSFDDYVNSTNPVSPIAEASTKILTS